MYNSEVSAASFWSRSLKRRRDQRNLSDPLKQNHWIEEVPKRIPREAYPGTELGLLMLTRGWNGIVKVILLFYWFSLWCRNQVIGQSWDLFIHRETRSSYRKSGQKRTFRKKKITSWRQSWRSCVCGSLRDPWWSLVIWSQPHCIFEKKNHLQIIIF